MKDFIHSRPFKMLIVAICVLIGVIIYTASIGGFSSVTSSIVGAVSTPLQGITTQGSNTVGDLVDNYTDSTDSLKAEIGSLQSEIDKLRNQLINYEKYKNENEQLNKYLDIKAENQDFEFVPATVIGKDPNDIYYGFTLNKGSISGVSLNDPVITESGVVGKVTTIGATYCYVTTILNPSLNIGCTSLNTNESGIVTTTIELADQGLCKFAFLNPDTQTTEEELIITSGLGGVFPKNLIIGTVKNVQKETNDISMYAQVVPSVDVKKVKDVMIMTSFTGQGDVIESLGK